jgi:5-methylcytosine-specific restriction protein A
MHPFEVGRPYTRKQVFSILGIGNPKGGPWYTGYARHGADWFLFCGVGTAGRTGHDYKNRFKGKTLIWYGKTGTHASQRVIRQLVDGSGSVYIFYRKSDRDPFTFAGRGKAQEISRTSPVEITWILL